MTKKPEKRVRRRHSDEFRRNAVSLVEDQGDKAEHAVDLTTEVVLSATVRHGTDPDSQTLADAVVHAQRNLENAGLENDVTNVVADKGYHSNAQLALCHELGFRT